MKTLLLPVAEEVDGILVFKAKKGDQIVVDYPQTWPSEQKRISGVLDYFSEDTGNMYIYVEAFYYKIGVNYKTAHKHSIKIYREERTGWTKTQQANK